MASHSNTLAWKIPWTEEPDVLQSMGSLRVGHDTVTSLSLLTCMHWRRKGQPTPVFLPGESQGQGSLMGCRLWGHTESDSRTRLKQLSSRSSSSVYVSMLLSPFVPPSPSLGFPGGPAGKEYACMREAMFEPWVGKIPWRREWQPT